MPYVIGIDPSLVRTGITVIGCGDDNVAKLRVIRDCGYGLRDSAGFDDSSDRIVDQAQKIVRIIDKLATPPELAVIEAFIPPREGFPSQAERYALWYGVWSALRAREIPRTVIQPTTLKKWATGSGIADKELVLAEVRKWWPGTPVPNHDVADSAVCAATAAVRLGWKMPFPTRRRHVEGLAVINWPEELPARRLATLGHPRYQGV